MLPNWNINQKPLSEIETRRKIYALAKKLGCEIELQQIFDRYDGLLKRCTNQLERQQIAVMANAEVHRLIGFRNALIVDGKEIIPADENYKSDLGKL